MWVLAINFYSLVYKSAKSSLHYAEIKLTAEKNPEVQEENICTKSNVFITIFILSFWSSR